MSRDLDDAAFDGVGRLDIAQQPMSVVLGADSLATRRSGIGRVTVDIGEALRHSPHVSALRLWVRDRLQPPEFLDQLTSDAPPEAPASPPKPFRVLIGRLPGVQRIRAELKKRSMRAELASLRECAHGRLVYHETNMITKPFEGATVVHVHDLSWLHHRELHPADRLKWIDSNLDRTIRDAARFVAVSEFTAESFSRELGVRRELIDIIPNAVSSSFRPRTESEAHGSLARNGLADRNYILSVSTLEPRKNFDRLVAAHRTLPVQDRERFPLVIVGGRGWGATLDNRDAEQSRREGSLRLLGYQSDDVLVDLTARAACVAYVSRYEGFGLPVLEAMATGTPVIASSTTAVRETAGNAARLVDPMDVDDIASGLIDVLGDRCLARRLEGLGLARATQFSAQRATTKLISCWQQAIREAG